MEGEDDGTGLAAELDIAVCRSLQAGVVHLAEGADVRDASRANCSSMAAMAKSVSVTATGVTRFRRKAEPMWPLPMRQRPHTQWSKDDAKDHAVTATAAAQPVDRLQNMRTMRPLGKTNWG